MSNNKKIKLVKELTQNNQKVYYSEKLHNAKIVYLEKNKQKIYYIFSYGGGSYENTYKKLSSNKTPYDLLDDQNNQIPLNRKICKIIKNRNKGLSDEKITLAKNRILRSLNNLIKSNKSQTYIIDGLHEDNFLFKIIYKDTVKNPTKNTNSYISNSVNIEQYSIYLMFDGSNNIYNLIILEKINNNINILLNKQKKCTNFDELTLKDTNLLMSWIDEIINIKKINDSYIIINQLIDDINNKIDNNIYTDLNNTDILTFLKEKENKISEEKEKLKLKKQISFTEQDIKIILNRVHGKDENGIDLNPKNLKRSDLPEFLAKYLSLKYGLILRSNVNTIHILNTENNCYEAIDNETLLKIVANDFGHNTISIKELIKSYDYINQRLKPSYNIIRFNNCIYDTNTRQIIKLTSPQLPYYDIYFNYNKEVKGELIQQFLYTSLDSQQVKGLLELIGYLFTVGNKENIILCFIGKGGGGKSVLSNILSHLFKKVSYLPIHNLNKNHEISILENKFINICNDTDNKPIEDNGTFKQISGDDNILINPKYRQPYIMPLEEIPKFIIVGNHFPRFKKLEVPIIQRLLLIEFKRSFRNTKEQKKNLLTDIINDNDNIEWLIYNSLQAYDNLISNGHNFILRRSYENNLNLYNKHSNPLKWIINELFIFDMDNINIKDYADYDLINYYYLSVDEVKETIKNYADNNGLDISEDNNITTKQLTNTIKSTFDLWSLKDNYGIDYKPIQKQRDYRRFYIYENLKLKE